MPPRKYRTDDRDTVAAYALRDIPADLWKRARLRALQEDRDMRTVLLKLLERYVRKGLD
jgi:hypothetical protein